jgi:phage terminase large subunit-like protein
MAERQRRQIENRLAYYKPYPKQAEFHAAGLKFRERLLMAANQVGKTWAGGSEAAMHATGQYPADWKGARFDRATVGWACGVTSEVVRDSVQRILVGRQDARGTGAIPKDALIECVPARGIADAIDTIKVQHVSGETSLIGLKSYSSGREKFQAETLDWVWYDEEPPADIYTEGLTRTNTTGGPVWMTFTPLLGVSEVVRRFILEKSPDRHVTSMTIDDAEHLTPELRAKIVASYPAHEVEARTKGIPVLGSGRIFPVPEESIACEHRTFPTHFPRLGAMDFGWDHPFAAVELVWDRDTDTVYVTRTHRLREASPVIHAAALRPWGKLRWAWPRDGRRETLEGAGVALSKQYAEQDLDMMFEHAQFEDGSVSVEAGLMDMLTRMQTGRFKVFKHLNDWWDEFRLYHRKDGKVVKEFDDLMAATRYGVMMLRNATTDGARKSFNRVIQYPKLSVA